MVDAKWCCENINSGHFKFKSVIGEVKELIETRTLSEFKDEFGDVLYFFYCWLYSNYKINLKMFGAMGSVEKFSSRLIVWQMIFHANNLEFSPKYLVNGSNYARFIKVRLALELAIKDQRGE